MGFFGLRLLVAFVFIISLGASSLFGMNDFSSADHCARTIATFAPHLFAKPAEGEAPLDYSRVNGRFISSFFTNHPQYRRAPVLIGSDSRLRFQAQWVIRGDPQNVHYHFLFESDSPGLQPQLNVHFLRAHPEALHLRTRLWMHEGKPQDMNLVSEAIKALFRQTSPASVWNIDVTDHETFLKIWGVMRSQGFDFLKEIPSLQVDGKGSLVALVSSLARDERLFLENSLVDEDEAERFQQESYASIYETAWFHGLLFAAESSGFSVKVIPVVHKNFWIGGDAISFRLRAVFR